MPISGVYTWEVIFRINLLELSNLLEKNFSGKTGLCIDSQIKRLPNLKVATAAVGDKGIVLACRYERKMKTVVHKTVLHNNIVLNLRKQYLHIS